MSRLLWNAPSRSTRSSAAWGSKLRLKCESSRFKSGEIRGVRLRHSVLQARCARTLNTLASRARFRTSRPRHANPATRTLAFSICSGWSVACLFIAGYCEVNVMGRIVAAMATMHAPQLFTRPPEEDPKQLDAGIAAMKKLGEV